MRLLAPLLLILAALSLPPSQGVAGVPGAPGVPDVAELPSILHSLELADGLDVALPDERRRYEALSGEDDRRRFRSLFWTRRDPDPRTFDNPVRSELFARARAADAQHGAPGVAGRTTDPGRAAILLGPPTRVQQEARFARHVYERLPWGGSAELVLEDPEGKGAWRFANADEASALLDRARAALVVSPSIGYDEIPRGLPGPDVSGVEWQELLSARDRYVAARQSPDFPIVATLNHVRLSRDKARAFVDVEVAGSDVVREKTGAGEDRHVTFAGLVTGLDDGTSIPFRDLAVLRGRTARAHIRVSLDLQPGRYRVTLLAREPLLDLLSFREEEFVVPVHDLPRLSASSLVWGEVLAPESSRPDLPLELRVGQEWVEPTADAAGGTALVRVYGATSPVTVRFLLDGADVGEGTLVREGAGGDQVLAARIDARAGRELHAVVWDPAAGRGLVIARTLGAGAPLSSRPLRLDDVTSDLRSEGVRLLAPKEGDNPISVTGVRVEAEASQPVGIFVDGSLEGVVRGAAELPIRLPSGRNAMDVVAAALGGLESGPLARLAQSAVHLESRTAVFNVRATLVPLYVAVEDMRKNRFVTGLAPADFQVLQDGQVQKVDQFEADTRDPVTIALLLDESRSMAPFLDDARAAFADLASSLREIDRGMVVGFNRNVTLRSDVTACKGCLVASILGSRTEDVEPLGGAAAAPADDKAVSGAISDARPDPVTAKLNPSGRLMDALEAATFRLASQSGRKIVLVATHGRDSGSRIGADRIAELARRYGVMVYVVGLRLQAAPSEQEMDLIQTDPGAGEKIVKAIGLSRVYAKKDAARHDVKSRWQAWQSAPSTMEAMAGASGGRAYLFDVAGGQDLDLPAAVKAFRNELAHHYYLGFQPEESPIKGLREISIDVPGQEYRVRGRSAYYPD